MHILHVCIRKFLMKPPVGCITCTCMAKQLLFNSRCCIVAILRRPKWPKVACHTCRSGVTSFPVSPLDPVFTLFARTASDVKTGVETGNEARSGAVGS